MTHTQQPEALRLADKYEIEGFLQDPRFAKDHWCRQAAAELRRLHAENQQLHEQMAAIGAGGVEPLRKQASTAGVADEHKAFEQWLGIKPCGAAHDFGWEAWKARASLAATHPTQQGLDAQTIKHISALSELVRMPNAEYFADAHNGAVRHLRALAAQAKKGGARQ